MTTTEQSENELWAERKPSYTETAFVYETALLVDDNGRDVDEIMAICESSATTAMEVIKA